MLLIYCGPDPFLMILVLKYELLNLGGASGPLKSVKFTDLSMSYNIIIQPIYVNNGTERQTKFYKADFFTNTLDMTP
mgnify:CR=1 FL=1